MLSFPSLNLTMLMFSRAIASRHSCMVNTVCASHFVELIDCEQRRFRVVDAICNACFPYPGTRREMRRM